MTPLPILESPIDAFKVVADVRAMQDEVAEQNRRGWKTAELRGPRRGSVERLQQLPGCEEALALQVPGQNQTLRVEPLAHPARSLMHIGEVEERPLVELHAVVRGEEEQHPLSVEVAQHHQFAMRPNPHSTVWLVQSKYGADRPSWARAHWAFWSSDVEPGVRRRR